MILPPTSEISHHHKVTNITMSPTSLSPFCYIDSSLRVGVSTKSNWAKNVKKGMLRNGQSLRNCREKIQQKSLLR